MPMKCGNCQPRIKDSRVKACTSMKSDDSIRSRFVLRGLAEKQLMQLRRSDDDRTKTRGESKIPASWHVCSFSLWAVPAISTCGTVPSRSLSILYPQQCNEVNRFWKNFWAQAVFMIGVLGVFSMVPSGFKGSSEECRWRRNGGSMKAGMQLMELEVSSGDSRWKRGSGRSTKGGLS